MDNLCNIQITSPTAPNLILDLLVAHGGTLPVVVLCRAGALMGISQSAVRVGLTRLTRQGKITRGTRGCYALNLSGPALARDIDSWVQKGSQTVAWHGHWLAVQDAGVLRSDKTAWRRHSLALQLRGLVPFQPGLHVRPDNLKGGVTAVRTQLMELGLSPRALVFRLEGLDPARQAEACALWDVEALLAEYCRFQKALEQNATGLKKLKLEDAVRESLLLGRAVIAHLIRDPLLPPALMQPDARLALVQMMKNYQYEALLLWRAWMELSQDDP
jgi:phenylacetic acid degradation operon negative regulatory protein